LSHLSTASHAQQRGSIVLSLAYILSHASKPFLALLHQWVGLGTSPAEEIDPDAQPWADLGITRESLPLGETGELRWGYTFSPRRMPGFVPREMRRTLFEAGRSLRLLREASGGGHPLCWNQWTLQSGWGWGQDSSRYVLGCVFEVVADAGIALQVMFEPT
jgi:hypothetical protein